MWHYIQALTPFWCTVYSSLYCIELKYRMVQKCDTNWSRWRWKSDKQNKVNSSSSSSNYLETCYSLLSVTKVIHWPPSLAEISLVLVLFFREATVTDPISVGAVLPIIFNHAEWLIRADWKGLFFCLGFLSESVAESWFANSFA